MEKMQSENSALRFMSLLGITWLVFLSSCQRQKLSEGRPQVDSPSSIYVSESIEKYPFLYENWRLDYLSGDSTLCELSFIKEDQDSLFRFTIERLMNEDSITSFEVLDFKRAYKVGSYIITTKFNENQKALYQYRTSVDDNDETDKDFIFGWYEFLYEKHELDQGQQSFFMNHRDSLRQVKGSDLIQLPSK